MARISIDCISDTHNRHKELELDGGDILIHSGDATGRGELKEILSFIRWFGKQPYKYKIFVPGNHDFGFEHNFPYYAQACANEGIILLNDSGIEIEGIKIWGSPITPWFHSWAFNRHRGEDIQRHWHLIPEDTEILITHGPSFGVRDVVINNWSDENGSHVGCEMLAKRIEQLKSLKLHVFGHIHCGAGAEDLKNYIAVNASSLNEAYKVSRKEAITISNANGFYSIDTIFKG